MSPASEVTTVDDALKLATQLKFLAVSLDKSPEGLINADLCSAVIDGGWNEIDAEGELLPVTPGGVALMHYLDTQELLASAWNQAAGMPHSEMIERIMCTLLVLGELFTPMGVAKITGSPVPERFTYNGWVQLLERREDVWDQRVVNEICDIYVRGYRHIADLESLRAALLLSRYRAKNSPPPNLNPSERSKVGFLGLIVDVERRAVHRKGLDVTPIDLTELEYQALRLLIAAECNSVPKEDFAPPNYRGSTNGSALSNVLTTLGDKLYPLKVALVDRRLKDCR
jgi:hypothetical protein